MTIVAGDILRTSCNFVLTNGQLYQNIFHHRRTGVGILTDAQHVTAIDDWATAMYAELVSWVKSNVVSSLCSVDLVEFVAGAWTVVENIGTFTLTFAPTNAGSAMPTQLSPYVIFKTDRPQSVGRKFLFPLTELGYDLGLLDGSVVTAIVAWADDAVNDIVIQVLDNLQPGITRVGVDSFLTWHTAIVTNVAGTQRRRRLGVGA